jgi:uncharacterized protein YndB with AHSA1/START domain
MLALLMMAAALNREVVTEKVVPCTPREVFALWSTRDGVRSFFAPDATIDPRAGGEYTILFAPQHDPEGTSHGTKGARIRVFQPGTRLAFEWIPFTARAIDGVPGPPLAPAAIRNDSTTTVELTFTPKGRGETLVRLRHRGFRDAALWEASHAYFLRVWPLVLESLAARCTNAA